MAVKSDGSKIRYRPVRVAIADIEPDDENARQRIDPAKLQLLAQSMSGVGQLQPVLLKEIAAADGGKRYQLKGGTRRRAAALLLGWTELDAVLMPDGPDSSAGLVGLIDNIQREQLTPYEQAAAFKALGDRKMDLRDVARLAGVHMTVVHRQIILLERLAPEIIEQWRGGHPLATQRRLLTFTAIVDATGHPDPVAQVAIWNRVVTGTAGGADASPAERRVVNEKEMGRLVHHIRAKLRALDDWFAKLKTHGEGATVDAVDAHELVRYLLGLRKTPPLAFPYTERRAKPHGQQRRNQSKRETDLRGPS